MIAPDASAFARRLGASGDALMALVSDAGPDEARWKPEPAKWSMLEIVGHLVDEERLDFRRRLELVLDSPEHPWPSLDPEGRVREGHFNARALSDLVAEFAAERQRSVEWLESLRSPAWTNAYRHPTAGVLTASALLHAWAAHDLLHIRQIVRARYAFLAVAAAPASLDYAGPW